ncbi:glycosyltransferase family 4 protein [Nautilia sp.]
MRVLFQSRVTLFSVPGGDTIQLIKTAEYLEKLGVKVDISTELEPDVKNYDIVHLFNLMRGQETYTQLKNAKRQGKPVALSTIYGLYYEYEKKAAEGIRRFLANILSPYQMEYIKIIARGIKNGELHKGFIKVMFLGYYKVLKEICKMTDIFLPNSESEMLRVSQEFGLNNPRYIVVPNAIDSNIFDYDKVQVNGKIEDKFKDCVLCVAKVSGRKNQLNLVKAMKDLPYKLVLIGFAPPNHKKYFEKVKKESGENVIFIGKMSHEELPQYYKVARVHVLPSWLETPGLVSLEAVAMKCNIVATTKGDTVDYFKDYAFYCEPDNVDSIRDAIIKAYESPFNEEFREYILNNFTWEKAAEKTLEGYLLALGDANGRKR